ncbi:hypothetical protein [Solidesulfovibrio sp.]|jgi:hypothetical protein|uniref:hypothetical protein n=1 Tax=Solidesulfovibrio sp. TaxID=2910990 RepID=UPI000EE63667|nr:hypothetical protein [Solidesulfovibrio sp.]MEA5090563.1 hypothetical protein [Solidesulfovibrio sp.]HCR12532.1 hypothetical protein [Desulfovibrio sp.]HML60473.1 hypothetical protein [Solidesulfovibrio sp.]
MSDELFVDGILGIGFGKGAVRIDFFAMGEGLDAKGQPTKERRQRLVMTTEGFVESFALLAGVMEKLKAAGLVAPRPAPGATGTGTPPAGSGAASPSPNF